MTLPPSPRASLFPRRRALVALLLATVAGAAHAQTPPTPWQARFYDPQPLIDDLVMPMPCGGAMVFRRIEVPTEAQLKVRKFVMGGDDPRFGTTEARREEFVEGSFTDRADPKRRYYYLAKYELSQLQLDAIAGKCAEPARAAMKPATAQTWFDAVQVAQRYTEWLLANAADKLPREDNSAGFLRLPTEAEWEYAARGGTVVAQGEFEARTFPMVDGMEKYVWFAGPSSSNDEVQLIGALKANPLGLHDMLGNVDEIVLEPFRVHGGRAQGQAGGYVIKGGNHRTPRADIRSSYRYEVPPFDDKGPRRLPTVGFRLALVAAVIPSQKRLDDLRKTADDKPASPPAPAVPAIPPASPAAVPKPPVATPAPPPPVASPPTPPVATPAPPAAPAGSGTSSQPATTMAQPTTPPAAPVPPPTARPNESATSPTPRVAPPPAVAPAPVAPPPVRQPPVVVPPPPRNTDPPMRRTPEPR